MLGKNGGNLSKERQGYKDIWNADTVVLFLVPDVAIAVIDSQAAHVAEKIIDQELRSHWGAYHGCGSSLSLPVQPKE